MMRRSVIVISLLLVLLLALVLALTGTRPGTRLLLERAIPLAPGELHIERIDGTLLSGVTLEGLRWRSGEINAELQQLEITPELAALATARLHFSRLHARGLTLTLPAGESESPPAPPTLALPFPLVLENTRVTDIRIHQGEGQFRLQRLLLAGRMSGSRLRLETLELVQPERHLSLSGRLQLRSPWPLEAELDWASPLPGELASLAGGKQGRGQARLSGELPRLILEHQLNAPQKLHSRGELRLFRQPVRAELTHDWQQLALTLPNGQPLRLGAGELHTDGELEEYRLALEAESAHLPELPGVRTRLRATGDSEGLQLQQLELDNDHGQLSATGTLAWAPQLHWDLAVQGKHLNPALFRQQARGRLDLDGRLTGRQPADRPLQVELDLHQLQGTLREQPLQGQGELQMRGTDSIRVDLRLTSNDAEANLHGDWGSHPDLHMELDVPALARFSPRLAGGLSARASITGSRQAPSLNASLKAPALGLGELSLSGLKLDLWPAQGDALLALRLESGTLRQGQRTLLDTLELSGRGRLQEHRLHWQLSREGHVLDGVLAGGLENRRWRGEAQRTRLRGPASGEWRQQQGMALELTPQQVSAAPICLREQAGEGSLCSEIDWRADAGTLLKLALTRAPLAPVATLLPRQPKLEGSLDGQLQLDSRGPTPQGQLRLATDNLQLTLPAAEDEQPLSLPAARMEVSANLDNNTIDADGALKLDDDNAITVRLGAVMAEDGTTLDGNLEARLAELAWVELLAPRLRNAKGRIDGRLTLAGDLDNPRFSGEISLDNGQVDIPEAGVALRDIGLTARGTHGGELAIDGRARSGPGQVRLSGKLETGAPLPWPLVMTASGNDFQVLDRAEAQVQVNPDLQLSLRGTDIRVRGDVQVPLARIRPRELPQQAVSVSRDARLVSDNGTGETDTGRLDLAVRVRAGEQVTFEGFGLKARLGGDVLVEDIPGQPPRLTGEVRIEEGRYRAYGQDLKIERGNLLFEGPPDNPGLDIIAVRPLPREDLRVGLEVTGTLRDPRARVFSQPPLEESQAMAWLLTGRPLSGASDAEANAILRAVTLYGLRRGDFITDPLGETLGVEVGIDTDSEVDQAALTLGKQLSSRLYLRYSMGLFESLSTVMLRYTLSRHLSLEARSSSQAQGADLIYRIETD